MNKLEKGMIFKNTREICEYLDIPYSLNHPERSYKYISELCEWHKENILNIVIDKVYENVNFIIRKQNRCEYLYNVGDILDFEKDKIIILKQIKIPTKKSMRRGYICRCLVCNHEYSQYEYNLEKHVGCPLCKNKIVVPGANDLWTTRPDIAKLLLNPEDGYKYTQGSNVKLDFICPICGDIIKNLIISNVTRRGLKCPSCSKSKSYPNRFMYNLLKYLNIEFNDEITFDWSRFNNTFKRYDFYIPEYGIIEMQGRQHFSVSTFENCGGRTLKEEIENDIYKKELAIKNGIVNYTYIDCYYSTKEYIKHNLLNSDFALRYDLRNVDWDYIDKQSNLNIVTEISKLWNSGIYDRNLIGKYVGLNGGNVTKYLNKAHEYGLIDYDKNKTKKSGEERARYAYYNKYSTPIICKEIGLYFGSIGICSQIMKEKYNTLSDRGAILAIINGSRVSRTGYTFQYITKQEFNQIKQDPKTAHLAYGDLFILE